MARFTVKRGISARGSGGLLLPGAPRNRAYLKLLGSESHMIVIGICKISPITAVPYRAKSRSLHARRSYFAPRMPTVINITGLVEAPGTAPGSASLIAQAVYRHSRLPDG